MRSWKGAVQALVRRSGAAEVSATRCPLLSHSKELSAQRQDECRRPCTRCSPFAALVSGSRCWVLDASTPLV